LGNNLHPVIEFIEISHLSRAEVGRHMTYTLFPVQQVISHIMQLYEKRGLCGYKSLMSPFRMILGNNLHPVIGFIEISHSSGAEVGRHVTYTLFPVQPVISHIIQLYEKRGLCGRDMSNLTGYFSLHAII
jgi:hypothetical protein